MPLLKTALSSAAAMYLLKTLLPLMLLAMLTDGQAIFGGECPSFKPMTNFTINQYGGQWFLYAFSSLWEPTTMCDSVNYTILGPRQMNFTLNRIILMNSPLNNIPLRGVATLGQNQSVASFKVTVPGPRQVTSRSLILYTDYHHIAVSWSCQEVTSFGGRLVNIQRLSILTRVRQLGLRLTRQVEDVVKNIKLNTAYLKMVSQSDS